MAWKIKVDLHTWQARTEWVDEPGSVKNASWSTYGNLKVAQNNKLRIESNQPINTKIFDEAIVLEYNGAITPEGIKEYKSPFIKEGDYKPIINFINSL